MNFSQPGWTTAIPTETVLNVARIGPIGARLRAPGTWGSLVGLAYFVLGFYYMDIVGNLVASAIGAYVAIGFCGEAELRLGKRDPGEIILDEVVAMPLCFLGWQWLLGSFPPWLILLAGFLLFRVFDISKPMMINSLQELPGGWGVVADDLAAALATCATLHLIHLIWVMV